MKKIGEKAMILRLEHLIQEELALIQEAKYNQLQIGDYYEESE